MSSLVSGSKGSRNTSSTNLGATALIAASCAILSAALSFVHLVILFFFLLAVTRGGFCLLLCYVGWMVTLCMCVMVHFSTTYSNFEAQFHHLLGSKILDMDSTHFLQDHVSILLIAFFVYDLLQ